MAKLLCIEDDAELLEIITEELADAGHTVLQAADGCVGLEMILKHNPDLVISDISMPGMNGYVLLKTLRNNHPDFAEMPFIFLSALADRDHVIDGLDLGADDYLTKPFSVRELRARIGALFRRVEALSQPAAERQSSVLRVADIVIDASRRSVAISDRRVELTAKEFDLLSLFASNPGRVYTRAQLLESVWGYGHEGYEHTVNSHINRLRSKIEHDPSEPRYLLTVWGVGYRFFDPRVDGEGGDA